MIDEDISVSKTGFILRISSSKEILRIHSGNEKKRPEAIGMRTAQARLQRGIIWDADTCH